MLQQAEGIELVDVLNFLQAVAETMYEIITSPFVIFSIDNPILNVLFLAACALLAYNVVIQASRQ